MRILVLIKHIMKLKKAFLRFELWNMIATHC